MHRRTLLVEWEDLKAEELRLLNRAAARVGAKLGDRLQVEVTAAGDRAPLFRLLRDEIGGRLVETIDGLEQAQDLSLRQFVDALRKGVEAVQEIYVIPRRSSRTPHENHPQCSDENRGVGIAPNHDDSTQHRACRNTAQLAGA